MRIRLTLDITRRCNQPADDPTEPPNVYDLSGAYIERDPSLDTETDPETRRRPRIGFNAEGRA